jgi:RimJ/RimL family protein N-acetyltransferase
MTQPSRLSGEKDMSLVSLRSWLDSDFDPYFEMNSDPEVMRHFPSVLTKQEALESFRRIRSNIETQGWGVWAVDVDGVFAGFTGLMVPRFDAPCLPCTEILWRFRREYWGRGVAYAAALKALAYGFTELRLHEIVAFTAASNLRSIRLMERLAFTRDLDGDFEHPFVPIGNPLRQHVLYRKRSNEPPAQPAASGQSALPRPSWTQADRY